MSQIALGRIDPRLVHGRVLPKWSEECGADSAVIIDDALVEDDFMVTIYQQTGNRQNIPVACCTIDSFLSQIADGVFHDHTLLVLFRDVETAYAAYRAGVFVPILNVGAVVHKGERYVQINSSVALTKEQAVLLQKMEEDGVIVRIQTMPEAEEITVSEAMRKIEESV